MIIVSYNSSAGWSASDINKHIGRATVIEKSPNTYYHRVVGHKKFTWVIYQNEIVVLFDTETHQITDLLYVDDFT